MVPLKFIWHKYIHVNYVGPDKTDSKYDNGVSNNHGLLVAFLTVM